MFLHFFAYNKQVVYSVIHRLQMLHIIEFYEERDSFILVQILEGCLSRHGKPPAEGLYACRQIWYLVLAHVFLVLFLYAYLQTFYETSK